MMCTATTSDGSDERVELRMTGSGFTWFYAGKALSSNVYLTAANFVLVFVLTILT